MKKIAQLLTVVFLLASVALVGCSSTTTANQDSAAKNSKTSSFNPANHPLAIVMILKGHPVHHIVQMGFLEKAKQLGYPAEILASEDSEPSSAIAMGETGIAKGDKGMIVWATDQSYYPFIQKAHDAGIKIAVPHFPIKEGAAPGLDVNLSADPYTYGQDAAKAIGQKVGGKGTVAISQGSFNTTENQAAKGFTEYMKKNFPNIKVLSPIEEGFDPAIATGKAVGVIQANKDLVGAFSTTGGGPTTWATAKDQTNRPDLVCIGMDYTEQNINLVKSGKIYAIVAQPLYEEAQRSVELLDKLLRGEKVPYFTPLKAPIVTASGIDKYAKIIEKVKNYNFSQ